MTRKDYVAIAEALSSAKSPEDVDVFTPTCEEMRQDIIGRISRVFQADNPRFDHDRFYTACEGK